MEDDPIGVMRQGVSTIVSRVGDQIEDGPVNY